MTHNDDAFWTALVTRLTVLRWGGSTALAAGLLPRGMRSGATSAAGSWSGDDDRRPPRATRAGLPRRMRV